MRLSYLAALCLLLLRPSGAHAEDIGPAQAQALQQQLKDWIAGLFGPSVKLPELPWQVAGEHDHYVITWPIPGLSTPAGAAATANVRPLDGGRWSIDAVKMPPSGTVNVTFPQPGDDAGKGTPMKLDFTIGSQETHGVIDPGLATPSTLHTELGNLAATTESAKQHQEQRFDRYLAETTLTPAQSGRLDLAMNGKIDGWKSASQLSSGSAVAIGAQSMRATARVSGVNRERVAALLTAVGGLIGTLPPDISTMRQSDLPGPTREQLRRLAEALPDMLTGMGLEETVDGLQVEVAGVGGVSLKRFLFGLGGESPDGMLRAWLDIGLDELASPSLPPKVSAFLPHHVAIKPTLSGVQTADLHKLALDALAEGATNDTIAPDIETIFSHGGIDLGLETLSFDVGPAKVEGTGHLTAKSPDTWHGEAHVVATGLDDLTAQARSNPDLQQALPGLIMLRGLAKPDGQKLVWDIVSDGPSVTVNGLDISHAGGGNKAQAKPPVKKPGQPPSR